MDELLPCPFCGTAERDDNQERGLDAWLQVASHGGHAEGFYWNVECFGCGIETRHVETPVAAIAAWNRRGCLRNEGWPAERARIRRELLEAIAAWRNNVGLHDGRTAPLTERELGANAACAAILNHLDRIVPEEG